MSTSAQLTLLAALLLVGLLLAVDKRTRPHWILLLYMVSNVADIGLLVSSRRLFGIPITASDLLLLAAIGATLTSSSRARLDWKHTAAPIAIFMVTGLMQIARGSSHGITAAFGEGRFVFFPLLWFVAYAAAMRAEELRRILSIFVVAVLAVAALGIGLYASTTATNLEFVHVPSRLAFYALVTLVILFSGLLPSIRRFRPLAVVILLTFLFAAGSRQAFVLAPLILLGLRRSLPRGRFRLAVFGLVGLLAAFAVAGLVTSHVGRTDATITDYRNVIADPMADGGVAWRNNYWRALLEETPTDDWLVGVGIWPYFSDLDLTGFDGRESDTPHNTYLLMALEGGAPLVADYLLLVLTMLRRYWSASPHDAADLALFVLVASHVLLGFNAEHRLAGIWPMMWLLLGTLDALIDRDGVPSTNLSPLAQPIFETSPRNILDERVTRAAT